jgi:hypothetical protein
MIHDYAHMNRKALQTAEREATSILAKAGINARWVDCPISHTDLGNYSDCQSAWQANDYTLNVEPNAMADLLVKSPSALGATVDCDMAPCSTNVFYDRVSDLAGWHTAPSEVLLGRVMARQIGQLLLGTNYHSRTGIMQASWSGRQLGMGNEMLFTPEESSAMKAGLAVQEHAWQSRHDAGQTQVEIAGRGNEPGASPANRDTADNRR